MVKQHNTTQVIDGQTSTDVVKTQSAAALVQQIEAEGLWFPRVKLLQGLSPEVTNGDGRPGQYHVEGHGAVPSIVLVPLGEKMSRRLAEGEGDDMLTLCLSDDGLEGKGDPGGYCPAARWRSGRLTTKQPSPSRRRAC